MHWSNRRYGIIALLHPKETFSKCKCTWKTLTVTGKSWFVFLNVCGRFASTGLPAAYSSPPVQKKPHHRDPALSEGPLPCWALPLPEVGGRPRGHGVKLLPQQPHLPQQRQGIHAQQDHHPELPTQQREPPPQAAAARRNLVQQVGCCRGDKEKVGHHHRQDEEEEEAVIAPADAAVEEKAVVVVVPDAQAAEFAVFRAVRKKQLLVQVWGWQLNSVSSHPSSNRITPAWVSKMNHACAEFTRKGVTHAILMKLHLTQHQYLTSQWGQNLWGLWFCSTRSATQENRGSASVLSSFPGLWVRTLQNKPKTRKEWTTETWIRGRVGRTHSKAKDNFTGTASASFTLRLVIQLICYSLVNRTRKEKQKLWHTCFSIFTQLN